MNTLEIDAKEIEVIYFNGNRTSVAPVCLENSSSTVSLAEIIKNRTIIYDNILAIEENSSH